MKGRRNMGLVTKEVEMKTNACNCKYYENLGYKLPHKPNGKIDMGKSFKVKIQDLTKGSNVRVDVKCDKCSTIVKVPYVSYNKRNHNGKYYCGNCANTVLNSGANNYLFNPNKSTNEKELLRRIDGYDKFVKSVLARDNYTCQCCNKKAEADIEVHHLFGYAGFPEYRTDQTQALCLCERCHKAFHSWHTHHYGFANKGNCTREQFEEWYGQAIKELETYNGELPTARPVYDYEEQQVYLGGAMEWAKIHKHPFTSVYKCCNRQTEYSIYIRKDGSKTITAVKPNTVKGHHLLWYDEYLQMTEDDIQKYLEDCKDKKNKPIICLTTNKYFDSITDGAKYYSVYFTGVAACCQKRCKSAGKLPDGTRLKWMYYSEFKQLTEEEQNNLLNLYKEE